MASARSCLALALMVLAPGLGGAQSNVAVVDAAGRPVPYAVVQHRGAYSRIANDSGRVTITATARDSLQLDVRRLGFRPFFGWVRPGEDGTFVVALQPVVQRLAASTIVAPANTPLAQRGFYDRVERARRGAYTAEFIPPEELEARNAMDVSRFLEGRRGIRVARHRLTGRPVILGRGGCGMNIILDGQYVRTEESVQVGEAPQSLIPTGSFEVMSRRPTMNITELVSGSEVMAIEIYMSTANAPAELVPISGRGSCGMVVIWTGGRQ